MLTEFEFDTIDQEIYEGSIQTVKNIALKQSKLLFEKGKVKDEDLQYFRWTDSRHSVECKTAKKENKHLILRKSTRETSRWLSYAKKLRSSSHFSYRKQLNKLDSSTILEKLASGDFEQRYFVFKETDGLKINKHTY